MSDLTTRLRSTRNWLRQDHESWKDATNHYDLAPLEAADEIERLEAELSRWQAECQRLRKAAADVVWFSWDESNDYDALQAIEQLRAALAEEGK